MLCCGPRADPFVRPRHLNALGVARCTPVIGRDQARSGSEHAQRAQQLYQTILGRLLPFDSWLGAPLSTGAEETCDP